MRITTSLPEFKKLTAGLAKALGGSVLRPPTIENDWFAEVQAPEMPLSLDLRSHDGRVEIGISWPTYKDRDRNMQKVTGRPVSITAALTRGADAIAKDIQRKLIPEAKPVYEAAVARCSQIAADLTNLVRTRTRLAKLLGARPNDHTDRFSLDVADIQVRSENDVRFEAFSVDVNTAVKVVALLRANKKGE